MAATKKVMVDVVEAGRKGGEQRRENLTPAERKRSAQQAIKARWDKYYKEHPEKAALRKAKDKAKKG